MQQNIKVDIVYYLMPSDFEMEFNLCGCCHMRLLNEKSQDKQGLVKALAKAVSRSKVIIVCGPLFDDNGLIKTVSTAIGRKTEQIKNSDYGIKYEDKIDIIEGSTPLVTPEGFFGGCIIESGPQSIIVLSESKSIRKTIMTNLVHQYIYELNNFSETSVQQEAADDEENSDMLRQDISADTTLEIEAEQDEEIEDIFSSLEENTEKENVIQGETGTDNESFENENSAVTGQIEEPEQNADIVFEQKLENATPILEMFIEPEALSPKKMEDYAKNYIASHQDGMFIAEEEYDYDVDEQEDFLKLPKVKLSAVIIAVLLALVAVVLAYLLVYIPYSRGIDYSTYIEQIFGPASSV